MNVEWITAQKRQYRKVIKNHSIQAFRTLRNKPRKNCVEEVTFDAVTNKYSWCKHANRKINGSEDMHAQGTDNIADE